jgi:hypothetical protein
MMLPRTLWTLVLVFASAASGAPASAGVVTLDFTGTVYSIRDDTALLDGSISLGSPFHLHFVYDETVAPYDSHPYVPGATLTLSSWNLSTAPSEMSFAVGTYTVAVAPLPGDPTNPSYLGVTVFDDSPSSPVHNPDTYQIATIAPLGSLTARVFATLVDSTATAITSPTQLSSISFDFDSWDPWSGGPVGSTAQIFFSDPGSSDPAAVFGRIENIGVSRVPEPPFASLAAIALALFGAGVRARR